MKKMDKENPFLLAKKEWNNHTATAMNQKNIWQIVAIASLLVAFLSVAGMLYLASLPRDVAHIVEVDRSGQVRYAGQASNTINANDKIITSTVGEFIEDMRTVTPDLFLIKRNIQRAYSHINTKDPTFLKANEWFQDDRTNLFKRAETMLVHIQIESVIKQTDNTYQVDWVETSREIRGQIIAEKRMRAMVTTYQASNFEVNEETLENIKFNPLSIFIKDYNWTEINNDAK